VAGKPRVKLVFELGKRQESSLVKEWLSRKAVRFDEAWRREGVQLMTAMERLCAFRYPRHVAEVTVLLHRRRRGDARGDMAETQPDRVNLYVRRRDTWASMRGVFVHELIHSLLWAEYYYGYRRKETSFFEDIFSDELLTSLLEQMVLKSKVNAREALDYALSCVSERLRHLRKREDYGVLLESWKEYAETYKRRIRESNALLERKRILESLKSPLPARLDA